jgi:hypothetical protein
MNDEEKKREYAVGYKKPPVHTRFARGQSGNDAGRPKRARNLKTDLREELGETIPVMERGERREFSKQQITLKALINKAMSGDIRAAAKVIELSIRLLGGEEDSTDDPQLSSTDEEILGAFLERHSKSDDQ